MQEDRKNKRSGFLLPFFLGIILSAAVFFAVTKVAGAGKLIGGDEWEYYNGLDTKFGKYYQILEMIESDPIAETTSGDIMEEDIRQALEATGDPYAAYYTPEEYKNFMKSFNGSYVGVGIAVAQDGEDIVVRVVYSNGSAIEAGMKPGDIITKVDGVKPESVDDAVSRITGEAGTSVTVTVNRDGKEMDFKMDRLKLDLETVTYKELEDSKGVGYISISSFSKTTDEDFKMAVKELTNKGCDRFIIDLRDNGGGVTDSSIEIADYLLPACVIMTDVYKDGADTVYNSDEDAADIKYVVLVNGNTASASEILSAAIQDNNGGKIIGKKTYGKGVTQQIHPFDDGSAVKITITEYFRPNGDSVNKLGITPDIEAEDDEIMDIALEELGQ